MPNATYHFPQGFLWGTATSSHQVEGNNKNNNWWAWEQQPGKILQGHTSGLACDWWGGKWKDDFDRAAETGQNAHRLSIEWSRIQPAPDRWDESALDYYRQMIRGLVERGMIPMVTLHHFSDPLWLVEQGGWENEAVIDQFTTYTAKVVQALREYVTLWVTINEPNVYAYSGYINGVFPPGVQDINRGFKVMTTMVKAHAAAYQTIHKIQNTARVGIALNIRGFQPARSWLPMDAWVASLQNALFNQLFPGALTDGVVNFVYKRERIPQAAKTQDFFGVNYYTTDQVRFDLGSVSTGFGKMSFPEDGDLSDTGFINNVPMVMYNALKWGMQFKVPMIVTENGVEDADDHLRPRYTVQHLHQIWRAVNFNWPIKGYFHWSLVDNFEWERGWTQRFGLWGLDTATQLRQRRPSVDLFAEICRENGISSDMVAKYAPEVSEKLFPA